MNLLNQDRQTDYGAEAVERPAEKVLAYGDKAVGQGVLVAQAPQKRKQAGTAPPSPDVDELVADLRPIFMEKFSRRVKGTKRKDTYGPSVGENVNIEVLPDAQFEAEVLEEGKRLASELPKTVLNLAPEIVQQRLVNHYKDLGMTLPAHLATINVNTKLTREEETAVFAFAQAITVKNASDAASESGGFYSPLTKKIFLRDVDAASVAHEMAHAYAYGGWNGFITLMRVRRMQDTDKLDEGMTTHIERIVVKAWHDKQPSGTIPLARYGSVYTAAATRFIKDVGGTNFAYEAYFGGFVGYTDLKMRPEDTIVIGEKTKKKWRWPWR